MKFFVKWLVIIAVLAGALHYLIYLRTGQHPLANWLPGWRSSFAKLSHWRASHLPLQTSLPSLAKSVNLPPIPSLPKLPTSYDDEKPTTSAYKWVDRNGLIHYSDKAPESGQILKLLDANPDTNVIQSDSTQLASPKAH